MALYMPVYAMRTLIESESDDIVMTDTVHLFAQCKHPLTRQNLIQTLHM